MILESSEKYVKIEIPVSLQLRRNPLILIGFTYLLVGMGIGALTGGLAQGISALANGRTFWTGDLKSIANAPIFAPTQALNAPSNDPDFSQFRSELPNTNHLNQQPLTAKYMVLDKINLL